MSDNVDTDRGLWRRCSDCGEGYTDRDAHVRLHIDRPSDEHLTITETAKALGRSGQVIRYWINHGKLRFEKTPRGRIRTWITKRAIRDLVKETIGDNWEKAAEWAKTGAVNG